MDRGLNRPSGGRSESRALLEILARVERRWRIRTVLRGVAALAIAGLVLWLISGLGMDRLRFSQAAVTTFRIVTYLALLGVALKALILPLLRRPTGEDVALYLEEHEPELNAQVLSALEIVEPVQGEPNRNPTGLQRAVVQKAVEALRKVDNGERIERDQVRRSSGALVAVSALALILLALGPKSLRTGATALALPTRAATDVSPYSISVFPGDLTIARASDQSVQADPTGFDAESVEILMRASGSGGEYESLPMFPDEEGRYEIMLLDVQEDTEYFVRSGLVRSAIHTLTVADLPYVETLTLEYVFPAYTGLDPVVYEDGGDVAALAGTRVNLRVSPTIPTTTGALLMGPDSSRSTLSLTGDGTLTGSFQVAAPGTYRVLLDGGDEGLVEASPSYVIDVLTDLPPTVTFTEPGRDEQVTSIEEVFLEAKVQDDYGVAELELVFQVNAAPEETVIPLYRASGAGEKEVVTGHTLFLEEFELEPGDLVTYWARARDQRPADGDATREVTSDLFFLSIRPFRTDVTQADAQGGQPQGGGGMGAGEMNLVQMQREVVIGTFNLRRDGDALGGEVVAAGAETLRDAQSQVRGSAEAMAGMMGGGLPGGGAIPGGTGIAEIVATAVADMELAEAALVAGQLHEALAPEQRALRALQQVFEALDEIQVAQGGQGGGGGGGGGPQQEILDRLGLDSSEMRSQYESVERGERQEVDQAIDETLERLKELARRQEQEAERQRRLGEQAGSSGAGDRQRQLAEEAEEVARELERLSRETGSRELLDTARQLRDAADAMRQSATRPGDPGAGAEEAADRLDEARRQLESSQGDRLEQDAADALNRARDLEARQERMTRDVEELDQLTSAGLQEERLDRLQEQKEGMRDEVEQLERDLDRLAARGRQEQPQAARELESAADGIRDDKLKEKVQYSQTLIRQQSGQSAARFEEEIGRDLTRLRERLESAAGSFQDSQSDRAQQAMEDARSLVQGLESMERRGQGQQGEEGQEGQGQEGEQGQEGQGTEGQPGGGQQGQPGEGGQRGEGQQGGGGAPGGQAGLPAGPASQGQAQPMSPDQIRQMRGEARQRAGQARELSRSLEEQSLGTEEIDTLIEELERLDNQRIYDDPEELAALQASILEEARHFEYALRRALQPDRQGSPGLTGNEAVPAGYRRLVEEYFRVLSTGGASADSTGGGGG